MADNLAKFQSPTKKSSALPCEDGLFWVSLEPACMYVVAYRRYVIHVCTKYIFSVCYLLVAFVFFCVQYVIGCYDIFFSWKYESLISHVVFALCLYLPRA